MKVYNKALLAAAAGAIMTVIGSGAAMATPVFSVNPNSIPGTIGGAPFQATDFFYTSAATVTQTGPTSQSETGYARLSSFENDGTAVDASVTRLADPSHYTGPGAVGTFGIYFKLSATVEGVSGFGGNNVGTVTSFIFSMYADPLRDTVFNPGDAATNTGASVTVGADDILLADGTLDFGTAGFQGATGAPTFSSVDFFHVDDPAFFFAPVPFYNLVFTSTTTASSSNVHPFANGSPNANLSPIGGAANFIPEPLTLSVFGAGLFGAAALRRRKAKKA